MSDSSPVAGRGAAAGLSAAEVEVLSLKSHRVKAVLIAVMVAAIMQGAMGVLHWWVAHYQRIPTSWTWDLASCAVLTATWAWLRRDPARRYAIAIHVTVGCAIVALLMAYAYGQISAVWWFIAVAMGVMLLADFKAALRWSVVLVLFGSLSPWVMESGQWMLPVHESRIEVWLSRTLLMATSVVVAVLFRFAVTRQAGSLRKLAADLAASNAAKDRLLRHLGHELHTPLHGVLALADQAMRDVDDEQQRQRLIGIRSAALVLQQQVADLLDYADGRDRIEPAQLTACRPAQLLREIESSLQPLAAQKGLQFRIAIAADWKEPRLGDAMSLRRILHKLASNAVKYTHQGEIEIRLGTASGFPDVVELMVRDTGIGIEHELQARLFEPFERGDMSSTRASGGLGLGLATVREVVRSLGGRIECTSWPGQGTVFTVQLPMRLLPEMQSSVEANPSVDARHCLDLLVCEDDPVCQMLLAEGLRSMGHRVRTADDGQSALEILEDADFDAIVTDLEMPRLDGRGLLQRLRERELATGKRACPVIAVTASMRSVRDDASNDADFDAWLFKPFLVAEVQQALERMRLTLGAGSSGETAH